ncbi:DUF3006 domain-containing protein [Halegenticoccus tardaugens]|uniref:DUF3006 domain-containing protein n=1 Tax=Halegenticoccus tardaugens TaxID=2071624 RepID=UPI00100B6F1D|nr:DUF3006 domain-containing protein [Halegenticoccus tardaugens]
MVDDGSYTATVDRVEGGRAVVLVEGDDEILDEVVLDEERLPADAGDGAVLSVVVEGGEVVDLEYDAETTDRRKQAARERFDRLSRRPDEPRD